MLKYFLAMILLSQFCFAEQVGDYRIDCMNYLNLEKLENDQHLVISQDVKVDVVQFCSFGGGARYLSFSNEVMISVCRIELRTLELIDGYLSYTNEPSGYHYAISENGVCPNMKYFTELTNLSEKLDVHRVIELVDKFRDELKKKNGKGYKKYFDLSLWDEYIKSDYSNFINSCEDSTEVLISDVSRYLLSNDEGVHLISMTIDGVSWSAVSRIDNESIVIKSISKDIQ